LNNKSWAWLLLAAALAAAVAGFSAWRNSNAELRDTRARMYLGELQPIAVMLRENQRIIYELQSEPFTEKDTGILESYLAKIRRDGLPKNAQMKQRLDQLAENDAAIVALIKAYAPHATTTQFVTEADKFRNYSSAWRDRWNSVMELFMAGGNYPTSGVPFPEGFAPAVDSEISLVTHSR
jgi:hypothetical protein